jgi:hypothetical protein
MATVVGTGLEGLQEALGTLGAALGQRKYAEHNRERAIMDRMMLDPEFRNDFLANIIDPAVDQSRASLRAEGVTSTPAGPMPNLRTDSNPFQEVGASLGLRPEFLQHLHQTSQGTVERETARAGRGVATELAQARVGGELAQAQASLAGSEIERDINQRLQSLGIAEQASTAQINQLRMLGAESELGARTAEAFLGAGVDQLRALAEVGSLQYQALSVEHATEQLIKAQQWARQLPPEVASRYAFAMSNPQFLQDIQFRENLSLQELMSRRGAESDRMADMFAAYLRLDEHRNTLIDRASASDNKDFINATAGQIANIEFFQTQLFPHMPLSGVRAEGRGRFFGADQADFERVVPLPVESIVTTFQQSQLTDDPLDILGVVDSEEFRALPRAQQSLTMQLIQGTPAPTGDPLQDYSATSNFLYGLSQVNPYIGNIFTVIGDIDRATRAVGRTVGAGAQGITEAGARARQQQSGGQGGR